MFQLAGLFGLGLRQAAASQTLHSESRKAITSLRQRVDGALAPERPHCRCRLPQGVSLLFFAASAGPCADRRFGYNPFGRSLIG